MSYRTVLSLLLVISLALTLGCRAGFKKTANMYGPPYPVEVDLIPLETSYRRGDPIYFQFSVRNHGSEAVQILRWGSPLAGDLDGGHFRVYRKNKLLSPSKTRNQDSTDKQPEMIVLYGGETISKKIDLESAYTFRDRGNYFIQYLGGESGQLPNSRVVKVRIK